MGNYRKYKFKNYDGILIFIVIMTLLFLYGITLYPHGGDLPSGTSLESFSKNHWLGTDNLGVDIFAQISAGYFRSLSIGLMVALLAFLLGGCLGILSGYAGGIADGIISFLINVFLSVPQLPIMIVVGAFVGQQTSNIIIILAIFSWARIAKQVRAKTKNMVEKEYIQMAKRYGGSPWYIFKTHMAMDVVPLLSILSIGVIGRAIIAEASLAFLGLSDPTASSWGMMMSKAMSFSGIYFTDYWKWWLMAPVLALIISVVSFRMLAKELEQYWIKGAYNGRVITSK